MAADRFSAGCLRHVLPDRELTLTSGQALGNDVTLCVNGHSVTGNVTVTGGSFTLTDCGSGSLTGDVTVNEGGSFTLEDCALSGKIENSGTLTVTGGTVTAADGIGVEIRVHSP